MSIKLNLNLDYVVDNADRQMASFKTNNQLTLTVWREAISDLRGGRDPATGGRKGTPEKSRDAIRVAARVMDKMTTAKNDDQKELDLEGDELQHIKDILDEWLKMNGVPETLSGFYVKFLSEVNRTVEAMEKAEREARELEKAKKAS